MQAIAASLWATVNVHFTLAQSVVQAGIGKARLLPSRENGAAEASPSLQEIAERDVMPSYDALASTGRRRETLPPFDATREQPGSMGHPSLTRRMSYMVHVSLDRHGAVVSFPPQKDSRPSPLQGTTRAESVANAWRLMSHSLRLFRRGGICFRIRL